MLRAFAVALLTSAAVAQQPAYRITHTYTLGGDGSWDYVVPDPPNHRLFVASARFGARPATGRGRAPVEPGTFAILVIEKE